MRENYINGEEVKEKIHLNYSYTAPEILSPGTGIISSKSDVFSIGAVLYFILTGR
jgi:serine/threonine protein kinase